MLQMPTQMSLPKIQVQRLELPSLLNEMATGKLQVPRFQRNFVWELTKTRALFDSMYKEFPIGTFFLWMAPANTPPLTRALPELGIPAPQVGFPVTYILDGQQRLTSLFCAISGIKVRSTDYGRICIDLEVATKYDQNQDEDFNEDIFVYRTPDNRRYISVHELVGLNHLIIYNQVSDALKPAYIKAQNILQTYPFSIVWIQAQTLANAIEIFQRINQAGKRLSRYDLVCANVWREDFDFRKLINEINKQFVAKGFGWLDETIFTQAFSLVLTDQCTTASELAMQTDQIKGVWDKTIQSINLASDFVSSNLGVVKSEFLPYRGLLVVLAYYFYYSPTSSLSTKNRILLWEWFWRVTLSERYSSTSPSKMADDAKKLRESMNGADVAFNYPVAVTQEAVLRTKMSSTTSALRNAVLCLLAMRQPLNFKDNSPVNLSDNFFSDLKKAERHHVFPIGFLKTQNIDPLLVHLLPNFCFIPANLNKEISSRAPADYMTQYQSQNTNFSAALETHLIPTKPNSAIWKNDFHSFLQDRAQELADQLNQLIETGPAGMQPVVVPLAPISRVDILEVQIRDFIDYRLTAMVGSMYWMQAIPSDINDFVNARIKDHLSHHPYEDSSRFASGRSKLDYCDVAHYEKIILKNWGLFIETFKSQDALRTHLAAYRALRNCVQHNRKPTDIEEKNGDAAMLWLERIFNQYNMEIEDIEQGDGDELA
jgi:hypothetical protein